MTHRITGQVFLVAFFVSVTGCGPAHRVTRIQVQDKPTEVEVTFTNGNTTLAGTLVLPPLGEKLVIPPDPGPLPAVVMLAGSSRGDRQGYRELARHFACHGIAALCYDSPGTGHSTGKRRQHSLDERTEEACAAVQFLRTRNDVRQDQISLWGISQGASVAIMTAARLPEVAFVIPVSTSGVSGYEQMLHFARASGQAQQLPPDDIDKLVTFVELFFERCERPTGFRQIEERVRPWRERPWLAFVRTVKDRRTLSAAERLAAVQGCLRAWREDPWWKPTFGSQAEFLLSMGPEEYDGFLKANRQGVDFNPQSYLKRVRCPALVLFGSEDVVGPVEKSAAIYRQGLEGAGNRDVTVTIFPGGNHGIEDAQGKHLWAYLDRMVNWIHAHTGKE